MFPMNGVRVSDIPFYIKNFDVLEDEFLIHLNDEWIREEDITPIMDGLKEMMYFHDMTIGIESNGKKIVVTENSIQISNKHRILFDKSW